MSETQPLRYDVFLSYNSKDKQEVRELKRRLSAEGLTAWLDEDELQPGVPWQRLLEAGIRASKSVAVLVGKDGLGPWENEEMQAALILATTNQRPVIPVLLPGAHLQSKLPMFLENRTWVNLGTDSIDDGVARLIWGITGSRAQPPAAPAPSNHPGPPSGRQVLCRLRCQERATSTLHWRPLAFLDTLCRNFPETTFYLSKRDETASALGRPANMSSAMDMMMSAFQNEDIVILEVSGKLEVMASTFLKIALENLDGYSDDPVATTARIGKLIDEASDRLYDPDLAELEEPVIRATKANLRPTKKEYRAIAVINDRLHDVSVPMIPLIAKHFGCELQIAFELPEKGIFSFNMSPINAYNLDKQIVDLEIQVGTKITVLVSGHHSEEAGAAVRHVLQNLWQCDHWLRSRAKDWDDVRVIPELIRYAKEMGRHCNTAYVHVQNPFISNLISGNVFVNATGQAFSKLAALEQLATPHAHQYDLQIADILKRVEEVERKQTVVPRPGFALAHAAMERSPRISISFGVYPDGVVWSKTDGTVNLVAMVICAQDTYKTWRDYMKRFSLLFRSVPDLQRRLLATRTSDDFVKTFRDAEISLARV